MKSSRRHWDAIFSRTEDARLGWYEKDASKTLEILRAIPEWQSSRIFLPGAGTSVLVEALLESGAQLVLNDISEEALNRVKVRLGERASGIIWLCQDIAEPVRQALPKIDIWIDRAVLHFLTDEEDIEGYFENVRTLVKKDGHALFAEFSLSGAARCAGLAVHRYSIEELSNRLGKDFRILLQEDFTYINPSGDPRPYIYAVFRRSG